MRHNSDRGVLWPGVIFRQGDSQGVIYRGDLSFFHSYAGAEAYILARNADKSHTDALAAGQRVDGNARAAADRRIEQRMAELTECESVGGGD